MKPMEGEPVATHRIVTWDVGTLTDPDVTTVDVIARLQLTAQRCGLDLRLENVGPELAELIDLAGLSDVLTLSPDQTSR